MLLARVAAVWCVQVVFRSIPRNNTCSALPIHTHPALPAGGGGGGGALEARLRQARVVYSPNCELRIWQSLPAKVGAGWLAGWWASAAAGSVGRTLRRPWQASLQASDLPCPTVASPNWQGGWGGKGGKRGRGSEGEEDEGGAKKPESVYLILKSGRVKHADYRCEAHEARAAGGCPEWAAAGAWPVAGSGLSPIASMGPLLPTATSLSLLLRPTRTHRKDDLWIISNSPDFRSGFAPGQVGDRSRAPWCAVVRSLWHGPNQDGK